MPHMTDAERIADLERRVAQLESVGRAYGPIRNGEVPTPPIPWPNIPNLGEQRCPTCGITLSPVMGYVCGKADCPTGLGGFSCTVATNTAI
jgi:hypothetical protein